MKDILIVAHFTEMPNDKGNGRFSYLADLLTANGHKVEVVTTDFSHETKKPRGNMGIFSNDKQHKITMLHESGYKKNVSLKRFYSHYIFGKNLENYLKNRNKPDLIYCAVPSLDAAYVAAKYSKEQNIRFVIDVQDLWPEAFKMIFNIPVVSHLIFFPIQKRADFIYRSADEIIAVSETYMNRALKVNGQCKDGISVFLGTELSKFDQLARESKIAKPNDEIWISYIGTLGHSYDLKCVIEAIQILESRGHKNFKLIVMGDGPFREKFENYAKEKGINSEFTGRLAYSKMVEILVRCDIAVNPIVKGAAQSIINKVGDYAAASLPVINTQECQEYQNLLVHYLAGINCETGNAREVADKILLLSHDENLRKIMGRNNRKLAEEKFDRNITYHKILQIILDSGNSWEAV